MQPGLHAFLAQHGFVQLGPQLFPVVAQEVRARAEIAKSDTDNVWITFFIMNLGYVGSINQKD